MPARKAETGNRGQIAAFLVFKVERGKGALLRTASNA